MDGKPVGTPLTHQKLVSSATFSPDGERLASAGGDGTVKIWNSTTGKMIQTIPAHTDSVVSVAFHPDGKHLASRSTGTDRTVKVWDLTATGRAVLTEPCTAVRKFGTAYTVAFSPDGQHHEHEEPVRRCQPHRHPHTIRMTA